MIKKTPNKKVISVILALSLVLALIPAMGVAGSAAETSQDGLWTYTVLDSTTAALGSGDADYMTYLGDDTDIVIPSVIDGYTITEISQNAFYGYFQLETIVIPDTVETIGDCAFSYCDALTEINIPSSVLMIGSEAFVGDYELNLITLPDNGLFTISTSFYETGYFNDPANWVDDTLCIGNYLIQASPDATSVTVPSNVKYAVAGAFLGCENMQSVTLPSNLEKLMYAAFYGCTALESVEIPASVTAIEMETFTECASLESVILHDGLESIGEGAFTDCVSLESIDIPDTVTQIGERAFVGCQNLAAATLSDSLESLEFGTFANCSSLDDVVIPVSVSYIGDSVFLQCQALSEITILNPNTTISDGAFSYSPITKVHGYFDSTAEQYVNNNPLNIYTSPYQEVKFIAIGVTLGDLDGDDDVSFSDYALIKLYVEGNCDFDRYQFYTADYNQDKAVDAFDLFFIDRFVNCGF